MLKLSRKLSFMLIASALLATSSAPLVYADDDRGWRHGRGMGWMHGGRGFMQQFGGIDANDDGRISDDEAAARREGVFAAMDADDNAELTQEEYMAVRMGPRRGRNKARQEQRQKAKLERFKPMDADQNGTVSKAEWMKAGQIRFAKADTDKDGVVTPWEFRSIRRQ